MIIFIRNLPKWKGQKRRKVQFSKHSWSQIEIESKCNLFENKKNLIKEQNILT